MTTISSRVRGSLYGVAVVDALGGPVEFCQRGSFPPVTKFRYNSNFGLAAGTWTDDTSMTLCLAQSLVDTNGETNVLDQVKKYVKWWDEGYMSATGTCFDIGKHHAPSACNMEKMYQRRRY
jgi:ADP-ribosylglycohydrolase